MDSQICHELDERIDASRGMRLALRMAANRHARAIANSPKNGPFRISHRLWLIETLEGCRLVGDWFYRDVLACVRETMERESKS